MQAVPAQADSMGGRPGIPAAKAVRITGGAGIALGGGMLECDDGRWVVEGRDAADGRVIRLEQGR